MGKTYFVSYSFSGDNNSGFSCAIVTRDKKIKSIEDVNDVSEYLKKELCYNSVAILNYIKMK